MLNPTDTLRQFFNSDVLRCQVLWVELPVLRVRTVNAVDVVRVHRADCIEDLVPHELPVGVDQMFELAEGLHSVVSPDVVAGDEREQLGVTLQLLNLQVVRVDLVPEHVHAIYYVEDCALREVVLLEELFLETENSVAEVVRLDPVVVSVLLY